MSKQNIENEKRLYSCILFLCHFLSCLYFEDNHALSFGTTVPIMWVLVGSNRKSDVHAVSEIRCGL